MIVRILKVIVPFLLVVAGACIATFAFLPIGLLMLCVAYILLAIILASRQSVHAPSAGQG